MTRTEVHDLQLIRFNLGSPTQIQGAVLAQSLFEGRKPIYFQYITAHASEPHSMLDGLQLLDTGFVLVQFSRCL